MKLILLTVAVSTLAITALHAQVLPGNAPPTLKPSIELSMMQAAVEPAVQAAVDSAVNPAVQEAMDALGLHKYTGLLALGFVIYLFLSRVFQGRRNGLSWLDSIAAAKNGTNVPSKVPLVIACLCMLSLSSCDTMKKLGAALSTPKAKQVERALADVGLVAAVAEGVLSPGDAVTIGKGVAEVTSADDGTTKTVKLAELGIKTAVDKGVVKQGDVVTIKENTALITSAVSPVAPILPPPAAVAASGK